MLVLSRKKNESIVINDNITITVVEIRGDKVRLGVEAPKAVPVHRQEVYDAIRRGLDLPAGATTLDVAAAQQRLAVESAVEKINADFDAGTQKQGPKQTGKASKAEISAKPNPASDKPTDHAAA